MPLGGRRGPADRAPFGAFHKAPVGRTRKPVLAAIGGTGGRVLLNLAVPDAGQLFAVRDGPVLAFQLENAPRHAAWRLSAHQRRRPLVVRA